VWYLSSESQIEREIHFNKIVDMGNKAIPLIIRQLEHPYIFEEFYLLQSLSEITRIDSVKNMSVKKQREFWEQWWITNKHKIR
jgi:hypothetical protein